MHPTKRRWILSLGITCLLGIFFISDSHKSLWRTRDIPNNEPNTSLALQLVERKLRKEKIQMEQFSRDINVRFRWKPKNPLRVLLVSTWRSGSTFLGEILSNHSASFHWYEPLMPLASQINDSVKAEKALDEVKGLFNCRISDRYLDFNRRISLQSYNPGIWESCQSLDRTLSICASKKFLEESCELFPILTMKLVRFRMRLTEPLLRDPSLAGLKIIHLVRDPRAMMNSRWKLPWCLKTPDCTEPKLTCDFMQEDYEAFNRLYPKYGDRMLLVRYEEMAMDPVGVIRRIYHFAGLQFTKRIEQIVLEKTAKDDTLKPLGTQKDSRSKVDSWKKSLKREQIQLVETNCQRLMELLEYKSYFGDGEDSSD